MAGNSTGGHLETRLSLLMRDGPLHVHFRPKLTEGDYEKLLSVVESPTTIAELREAVETLAERWGKEVECDE